jgi:YD repeat-containing protein
LSDGDKASGLAISKPVFVNSEGRFGLADADYGYTTFSSIRLYESDEVRTATNYDDRGNVASAQTKSDPRKIVTRYEYDRLGRQTKKTLDAGGSMERQYTTVYDANGNMLVENSPWGDPSAFGPLQNPPIVVQTVHQYDNLNRLIKTIPPIQTTTRPRRTAW